MAVIRFLFRDSKAMEPHMSPEWRAIMAIHRIIFTMLIGFLILSVSFCLHLYLHYMRGDFPL